MSNITPFETTLEKTISRDGYTVTIRVYKGDEPKTWVLDIEDEFGGSTLWEDVFPTPQLAMKTALQAIEEDGIQAYIFEPSTDLDEPPTLNRFAITIIGTQAFADWINSLDASQVTVADVNEETTTFMVDVDDDMGRDSMDELVKRHYETIFEVELAGWYLDETAWPQPRDWDLFQQFFTYSISSVVYDLGRVPVGQEGY